VPADENRVDEAWVLLGNGYLLDGGEHRRILTPSLWMNQAKFMGAVNLRWVLLRNRQPWISYNHLFLNILVESSTGCLYGNATAVISGKMMWCGD
jgi:hypothetical protein